MIDRDKETNDRWIDPDDAPVEWPDEVWDRAQIAIGGRVVRQATGTFTKPGLPRSRK